MQTDERLAELRRWLSNQDETLGLDIDSLRVASDDASFRRYFRVDAAPGHGSLIAMDAPPPMEDCRPFVHAAEIFLGRGVSVPRVIGADLERGFLLLEDFGQRTLLQELEAGGDPQPQYRAALHALRRLQSGSAPGRFPDYDRAVLLRELMLFPEWYVARHKGIELTPAERQTLESSFETLISQLLGQARVDVHRDYHSRNLMVIDDARNPGVLDFQDALHGPITYDLVSLLRDAYVEWDEEQQIDWAVHYWQGARDDGLPVPADFGEFYRDFEWMGLQRHLKVLGIFARLWHRDGKSRYLADMPTVLRYVLHTASRYGAFAPLLKLIDRIEGADPAAVGYSFVPR